MSINCYEGLFKGPEVEAMVRRGSFSCPGVIYPCHQNLLASNIWRCTYVHSATNKHKHTEYVQTPSFYKHATLLPPCGEVVQQQSNNKRTHTNVYTRIYIIPNRERYITTPFMIINLTWLYKKINK